MQIWKKTIKAHSYNEDRFVLSKRIAGVIDGATGIGEKNDNRATTASKLVAFLKEELERFKGGDIIEYLLELSSRSYGAGLSTATCGMALAYFEKSRIKLVCIGDCEILLKYREGRIEKIQQEELLKLDKEALGKMLEIAKARKISPRKARAEIDGVLLENRKKANAKGGYSVFQPQKTPDLKFTVREIDEGEVEKIILCSDGFSQCYTTLKFIDGYKGLFEESADLDEIADEVNALSREDKDYEKYPRFKLVDDITYVCVKT